LLVAKIAATPLLPTAKSANGVTVVVTGGLTLLPGTGSAVGEVTLAVLVSVPVAGAVTTRVKLVVAPDASAPNDQLATPALVVPPAPALIKITPCGKVSVTITPLAVEGPKFVTDIV